MKKKSKMSDKQHKCKMKLIKMNYFKTKIKING